MKLKANNQISPYLKQCCVRASANVSYENAARDIKYYTGMEVSKSTQQRLVQGYQFQESPRKEQVKEVSVDGGKVRLRTPKGQPSQWRDYKAVCANGQEKMAWFGENESVIEWVKKKPLANPLTCLGDGHRGIWNLIEKFSVPEKRREILDWFHLMENLHKVRSSKERLKKAEGLLWQGKVEETIELFSHLKSKPAQNFCLYLHNHQHRIVNYDYYQQEQICSVGSGAVESTIKQID